MEEKIKFKIKSAAIRQGWYILYSLLFPLFFALLFSFPWLLFASLIVIYPICILVADIKKLRRELKEVRAIKTEENEKE